jgi:hypothetical protein
MMGVVPLSIAFYDGKLYALSLKRLFVVEQRG